MLGFSQPFGAATRIHETATVEEDSLITVSAWSSALLCVKVRLQTSGSVSTRATTNRAVVRNVAGKKNVKAVPREHTYNVRLLRSSASWRRLLVAASKVRLVYDLLLVLAAIESADNLSWTWIIAAIQSRLRTNVAEQLYTFGGVECASGARPPSVQFSGVGAKRNRVTFRWNFTPPVGTHV